MSHLKELEESFQMVYSMPVLSVTYSIQRAGMAKKVKKSIFWHGSRVFDCPYLVNYLKYLDKTFCSKNIWSGLT